MTDSEQSKLNAFNSLRKLMGYVQNSSETVVTLSQDDVTKTYVVKVGADSMFRVKPRSYYGDSLIEAIAAAAAGEAE